MAGRQWRLMWEDGQSGIFQFKNTATTGVRRTTQLADSHADDPHLCADLPDRIASHAVAKVVVQQAARSVVNDIKVPSASALLGLVAGLAEPGAAAGAAAVADQAEGLETASVRLGRRRQVKDAEPEAPAADVTDAHRANDNDDAHSVYASNNIWDRFTPLQPTPATPKSGAKAKAKPNAKGQARAPKQTAQPKNSNSKAKGKRGATDDEPTAGEEVKAARTSSVASHPSSLASLGPAEAVQDENKDKAAACSMSRLMTEADEKWTQDMTALIQETLHIVPRADDEGFKADMLQVAGNLSTHLTEVRSRKRVVKRRTAENSQQAMSLLESLEDLLVSVTAFLKAVKQNSMTGDELFQNITAFQENSVCKARFGVVVITKTLKALLLDDLKWQRWPQMIATSFSFAQKAGRLAPDRPEDAGEPYFLGACLSQQMCVVLAKLLKSIAAESAT